MHTRRTSAGDSDGDSFFSSIAHLYEQDDIKFDTQAQNSGTENEESRLSRAGEVARLAWKELLKNLVVRQHSELLKQLSNDTQKMGRVHEATTTQEQDRVDEQNSGVISGDIPMANEAELRLKEEGVQTRSDLELRVHLDRLAESERVLEELHQSLGDEETESRRKDLEHPHQGKEARMCVSEEEDTQLEEWHAALDEQDTTTIPESNKCGDEDVYPADEAGLRLEEQGRRDPEMCVHLDRLAKAGRQLQESRNVFLAEEMHRLTAETKPSGDEELQLQAGAVAVVAVKGEDQPPAPPRNGFGLWRRRKQAEVVAVKPGAEQPPVQSRYEFGLRHFMGMVCLFVLFLLIAGNTR